MVTSLMSKGVRRHIRRTYNEIETLPHKHHKIMEQSDHEHLRGGESLT